MLVQYCNKDELVDRELAELKEDKMIVMGVFAHWCGGSKNMEPKFKSLANGVTDVTFLHVDYDNCDHIKEKYSIKSTPTFIVQKGEKVVVQSTNEMEPVKDAISRFKSAPSMK